MDFFVVKTYKDYILLNQEILLITKFLDLVQKTGIPIILPVLLTDWWYDFNQNDDPTTALPFIILCCIENLIVEYCWQVFM